MSWIPREDNLNSRVIDQKSTNIQYPISKLQRSSKTQNPTFERSGRSGLERLLHPFNGLNGLGANLSVLIVRIVARCRVVGDQLSGFIEQDPSNQPVQPAIA